MTAHRGPHAELADAVEANIRGQAEADRTLGLVAKDVAHPDALHVAALEIWRTCGNAGLLGFHRRLQKVLERRPA